MGQDNQIINQATFNKLEGDRLKRIQLGIAEAITLLSTAKAIYDSPDMGNTYRTRAMGKVKEAQKLLIGLQNEKI